MSLLSDENKKDFAGIKISVLPEDYFVVHLPSDTKAIPGEWYRPATTRFAVFIRDEEEINLIIPRRKWLRMQSIFEKYNLSGPFKVIVFDRKLSMKICSYMGAVGAVLSDAGIMALPVSSFSRDHIIVEKDDLPRAVKLLRQFISNCEKEDA